MGIIFLSTVFITGILTLLYVKSRVVYHCGRTKKDFRNSLRNELTTFNWGKAHTTYCPYCRETHWVTSRWK